MYRFVQSRFRDRDGAGVDRVLMRGARALLDWSQDDLAVRAGVQRQVVSKFENGTRIPHPANLERLIAALRDAGVTSSSGADGSVALIIRAHALHSLRSNE